jgi:hypothetical protein
MQLLMRQICAQAGNLEDRQGNASVSLTQLIGLVPLAGLISDGSPNQFILIVLA